MKTKYFLLFAVNVLFLIVTSNAVFAGTSDSDVRVLKVVVVGSGAVSAGGSRCAGHCSFQYSSEKTLILKAVPAQGWTFVGWEDDCSGSGDCTLVMDEDKTATALFTYP